MLDSPALDEFLRTEFGQLVIAALLGALIGLERELARKDPSFRTFSLISLGSALFALISLEVTKGYPNADPSRVTAQIVTGIGFLGAGAIFRSPRGVVGLTTAALMWVTAAIGAACGLGLIELAVSSTLLALVVTVSLRLLHRLFDRIREPDQDLSRSDD